MISKSTIYLTLTAIAFTLGMSSCLKTIPFNEPESEPRLVVNGYLQPNEVCEVAISVSTSILSTDGIERLSDATAVLFENGNFLENLTFSSSIQSYVGTETLSANRTYRIEVSHPDYSPVNTSTTIPSFPISPELIRETQDDKIEIEMKLADTPGVENKYHFWLESGIGTGFDLQGFQSGNELLQGSNSSEFENDLPYYYRGAYLEDITFQNQNVTIDLEIQNYKFGPDQFKLSLVNCSDDYWFYNRSKLLENESDFNIFAQPIQIYSNIEGGFGCFAGFSQIDVAIE